MRRRRNPFPGVATVEDRHGKRRYRLRRVIKGQSVDVYLPGPYGSPAFRAGYDEAVEGARVAMRRSRPGTVGYLVIAYLESTAFRNLSEATRKAKRSRLDWIREAVGQGRYATMEPRHVEDLMAKKGGQMPRTGSRRTWPNSSGSRRSGSATLVGTRQRWRTGTRLLPAVTTPGRTRRLRSSGPHMPPEPQRGWRWKSSSAPERRDRTRRH